MDTAKSISSPKAKPTVRIVSQQAYDLSLNVSLLPAGRVPVKFALGCQPRQGGERQNKDALDLPEPTRRFIEAANIRIIEWLSENDAHARAFTADPMAALLGSGLATQMKWERSDLKALARLRSEFAQAQAVVPGLQLRQTTVAVNRSAKISDPPKEGRFDFPAPRNDKDCGCKDQVKGQG
jgi:hypothetical protein